MDKIRILQIGTESWATKYKCPDNVKIIFAGGTIVARTLFAGPEKRKSGDSSTEVKPAVDDKEYEEFRRAKKLKEELDEVKRNLDIDNQ